MKNIVNLRKTCFFSKTRLRAHAQLCGFISRHKCRCIQLNTLTKCFSGLKIGNCAIHFKCPLHEKETVPKSSF